MTDPEIPVTTPDRSAESSAPPAFERAPPRRGLDASGAALRLALFAIAAFAAWLGGAYVFLRLTTHTCCGPEHRTRSDAQQVQGAAVLYLGQEPGASCPTVGDLLRAGVMDRTHRADDAWGRKFEIRCEGDDVYAISRGPDGVLGTPDDVAPQ